MFRLFALLTITLGFAAAGQAAVRVTTADALKAAISKPQPVFSAIAKQMKVAGKVEVEVVIAEDGTVEGAKALSGNPLLTSSAITAVKKWKFTPFEQDGQPAKANAVLSFDFQQ
jgi:TonB family protein